MKKGRGVMIFVFAVLGFGIALQIRSVLFHQRNQSSAQLKNEQIVEMIKDEKKKQEALTKSIAEDEKRLEQAMKSATSSSNSQSNEDKLVVLNHAKMKAGLTEVKGPGIQLTLDDAPARQNIDIRLSVIHDSDIRKLVNDIKKAGAQSISINGERLMPFSEQICAGPTILINKSRYPVPYVIRAIGPADTLMKQTDASERLRLMRRDGIKAVLTKSDDIRIPAYNKKLDSFTSVMEAIER